jgi:hypothetical protein
MLSVVGAIRSQRAALGFERADGLLERPGGLPATCRRPAPTPCGTRALLRTPDFPPSAGDTLDPARLEEARELHRLVHHQLAHHAGGAAVVRHALPGGQPAAQEQLRSWAARCLELARAGTGAQAWPIAPLAESESDMRALAEAGHPLAQRWVGELLLRLGARRARRVRRARRPSSRRTICFDEAVTMAQLVEVGLSLYEALFRTAAGEPWVLALLDDFAREAERPAAAGLRAQLRAALRRTQDAHLQATLRSILVRAALATGEGRRYAQALAWRERARTPGLRTRRSRVT